MAFKTDDAGRAEAAREIYETADGWLLGVVLGNPKADPVVRERLRALEARHGRRAASSGV